MALFSADGRRIAQACHIPLHLGSLMGSVGAVLKAYPAETAKEGAVFICNRPICRGRQAPPDISLVSPVLADGRLRDFSANIGHHLDAGGPGPGSFNGGATSIFEGIGPEVLLETFESCLASC